MRVQDDPIRIGEEASPSINSRKSVTDGDIEAFADASDLSKSVMSLNVAV